MPETLRIFAHRGASSVAPENTLAAIELTKDTGTNWFEFDVGCLKDGSLVVIHDDTVDRTSNGTGLLCNMQAGEVRRLDAGAWFADKYKGELIPFLSEVVEVSNEFGLSMNLEMKSLNAPQTAREAFVADVMRETAALDASSALLISSFDHGLLEIVRQMSTDATLGYLIEIEELVSPKREWLTDAIRLECSAIHPPVDELTPELVSVMRSAGLDVNVWTVNDPDQARRLESWGVTGIFTDDAKHMISELS